RRLPREGPALPAKDEGRRPPGGHERRRLRIRDGEPVQLAPEAARGARRRCPLRDRAPPRDVRRPRPRRDGPSRVRVAPEEGGRGEAARGEGGSCQGLSREEEGRREEEEGRSREEGGVSATSPVEPCRVGPIT